MIREVICDYCGKASWTEQPFKRFCNTTHKSNWHGVNNPKTKQKIRIWQKAHWQETYKRTHEYQLKRTKIYKENHKDYYKKYNEKWRNEHKEWFSEYGKQYRIKKALSA